MTAIVLASIVAPGAVMAHGSQSNGSKLEISVLSNRADLLSGGDALVEIDLPLGASIGDLSVGLRHGSSNVDVTSSFALRPNGQIQGLVTGIPDGASSLVASVDGRRPAKERIALTNHPIGGPVFAGAQVQPWFCGTTAAGLGDPIDTQCNAPSRVDYFYRPVGSTAFAPYDPASPPADVATTTTDRGVTVPYVVRRQMGTLDRAIYAFAVLAAPGATFAPWSPPAAWNGKLYYPFGGGAAPSNFQGAAGNVLLDIALSKGFTVGTTSLNTFGNNLNSVVSAETLMMLKERIVESFGPIRYTFSTGGSGGAMQQHLITNAYPGLLDGIMPSLSFADLAKNNREVQDCALLVRYFHETSPGLWPDVVQRNAVFDNQNVLPGTCESWPGSRLPDVWGSPRVGCVRGSATIEPWMYDPTTNPTGTRCTIQDYMVSLFGTRPDDGFANSIYDNVGVQYGLVALKEGVITLDQFVDLNERVGGLDIDRNATSARAKADLEGLRALYRTGQLNMGTGMDTVPIIDVRSCSNVEIHSCYHSWVMRARLAKTHGDADNQVIIVNSPANLSFDMMDRWLAAIEADHSNRSKAKKVVVNKPADVVDSCWIDGVKTLDEATCRTTYPYFGNPHLGAGDDIADDVMKCRLMPLKRNAYSVTFTDEQWTRLRATFPGGVCDWSKPSVGFREAVPWLSYTNVVGGRPLGAEPTSH